MKDVYPLHNLKKPIKDFFCVFTVNLCVGEIIKEGRGSRWAEAKATTGVTQSRSQRRRNNR